MAKTKPPAGPFTAEEAAAFTSEIFAEAKTGSDRALILVSTAVVDEALRRTLESFMVDTSVSRELLVSNGPIGTMAARIQLAEALGLIASQESRCLNLIRGIRNEYAHRVASEINVDSLADRVENLRTMANSFSPDMQIPKSWKLRHVFGAACVNMISILTLRLQANDAGRRSAISPANLDGGEVHFPAP